ncbi:hypothetical protein H5P28_13530 [Ruficoccus amylovorans]|uniref:DUF4234 domain-containing protein n=1 Tax=Ruficoccus amylovorans TaxID=1804625 RepID=A0A842HI95_9BACT|nr:hypothetical protein [Ruficoccus amylovorans]MBC2595284.1 hypothetical protein [Ruficoccus amylovorans]
MTTPSAHDNAALTRNTPGQATSDHADSGAPLPHPAIPDIPRRPPALHWLFVPATFTCYGYVWAFLIMRDVNRLGGERPIPVRGLIALFCPLYLLYLGALGLGIFWVRQSTESRIDLLPGWLLPTGLVLGLLSLATVCYGLVRAARQLHALGLKSAPGATLTVTTTILYMLSLPLLQDRLNKISKSLSEG